MQVKKLSLHWEQLEKGNKQNPRWTIKTKTNKEKGIKKQENKWLKEMTQNDSNNKSSSKLSKRYIETKQVKSKDMLTGD